MKHTKSITAGLFSAALFAAMPLCGVLAQQPAQPPATQQQGKGQFDPTNIDDLFGSLDIGPLMMTFGGASGMMTDFTRSAERQLLQRTDVRSELFIDSKQRDDLTDLDQHSTQDLQSKMIEAAVQGAVNNPDLQAIADQAKSGKPDPDAIKTTINSVFQQMQTAMQSAQTAMDAKFEGLLRPKQLQRLHELDLQWRGLLSLSDKKVADEIKATPDQRSTALAELKEYQKAQINALKPAMKQMVEIGQQAAKSNNVPGAAQAQDMKRMLAAALESDAIVKVRTAAEAKIRASLTSAQLDQWKAMNGRKFYFAKLD